VFLLDHLGTIDADLFKQVAALEQAGYASTTNRTSRGRRAATT
jgi:hypothetical protein